MFAELYLLTTFTQKKILKGISEIAVARNFKKRKAPEEFFKKIVVYKLVALLKWDSGMGVFMRFFKNIS